MILKIEHYSICNMLNILLLSPTGTGGGIVHWTNIIQSYYEKIRPNDILIKCYYPIVIEKKKVNVGGFIKRISNSITVYSSFINSFKKEIKTNNYEIVHIATSASYGLIRDLLVLSICRWYRIKTVVHFHFGRIPDILKRKNWEYRLLHKVITIADSIIVMDRNSYLALDGNQYNNIHYVPNPLSDKVLSSIKGIGNVSRIPRTIMFAGQILKTKGVFELVDACKSLPDIKLKIYGRYENGIKEQLEILAGEDCKDWMEILGKRPWDEVLYGMMCCDIFVLPSYTEGFPNVIIEAMAAGCAIVATKVGAIPEMLEAEQGKHYGLLVKPRDTEQLKNAIDYMLSNDAFKDECRKNTSSRVSERYNMDKIWQQLTSIWQQCLTI